MSRIIFLQSALVLSVVNRLYYFNAIYAFTSLETTTAGKMYLPKLAVLSAFGMVLYQGLAYTAAHYTSATNMGIVNAFIPIFTIFVSLAILKMYLTDLQFLAVFCLLQVCSMSCVRATLTSC